MTVMDLRNYINEHAITSSVSNIDARDSWNQNRAGPTNSTAVALRKPPPNETPNLAIPR